MLDRILSWPAIVWNITAGPDSSTRTLVLVVFTSLVLWIGYKLSRRALRKYMQIRAFKQDNVENFLFFWRYFWMASSIILISVSFSGSIAGVGISAAFLGMILGWSLQAPVTGIAAWLMIILKRPFKIGDRVIINGITGDVIDINLTHVLLNQVGGTIGGEEKSGRGVLIPNATLFAQVIYNYTVEEKFLLDEVLVHVPFESDIDEAERICIESARAITQDIIDETKAEPFIRMEFTDWGLRMRVRYKTIATDRQRITSEITRQILKEFKKNPKVEFRYPLQEIRYRPKEHLSQIAHQQKEFAAQFGDSDD